MSTKPRSPEVDMTGYTPLPESERLPSMSELEGVPKTQGIGKTPLDDMMLEDELRVPGFSTVRIPGENGEPGVRFWVPATDPEE